MSIPCTASRAVNLDDIIAGTPPGQVPMFMVTSSPDEYVVGEMVYFLNGHWTTCMSEERISKRDLGSLDFQGYIESPR